jgi:hypothetical protein
MLIALLLSTLTCTSIPVTTSSSDARGRFQYELRLPEQPLRLNMGSDINREWCVSLAPNLTITKVRTFLAFDRGGIGEVALTVTANDYKLATRSEHKESPAVNYDAMRSEDVRFETPSTGTTLAVYLMGHNTGSTWTRLEVGVILDVERQ